jgi:hypothetical protein
MNPLSQDEKDKIDKIREKNDKMEEFFNEKRTQWNKNTDSIFKVLSTDLSSPSNATAVFDAQADALTLRQQINDSVNYFLNRRSKETSKLKIMRQEKLIFYATGFPVKTNTGEKVILIEGHISENERTIELIDSYIDFLRDTSKNLESFGFSIKNRIELMNYLGK